MTREIRLLERPSLRIGLLVVMSAFVHLIILVSITGALGSSAGVSRLPGMIFVSVVPKAGPVASQKKDAFKLDEHEKNDLAIDVSAKANVPDKIQDISVDRLKKARVSKPEADQEDKLSSGGEENLINEIPDSGSSLELAQGFFSKARRGLFFLDHHPDGPPKLLESPPRDYRGTARERGLEGIVSLNIEVLENGGVGDVYVKRSSGYRILDEEAIEFMKKCRFIPSYKGGRPVSAWIEYEISFEISDSSPAF